MADVRYDVNDRVATLTLARPGKRNALSRPVLAALRAHTGEAQLDDSVRVLLLAAEGPAFCSGADLSGDASGERGSFAQEAAAELAGLLSDWIDFPKPLVARVQGPVVGGGNGLLAVCDVVVSSTTASFALREVRLGVVPAVIALPLMQRLAPGSIRDLMLTGRRIDADEARRIGLVDRIADPTELDTAVRDVIDELLLGGPRAQAAIKRLLQQLPGRTRAEGFALATDLSVEHFLSEEGRKGIAAFGEKRSPSW